MPLFYFQVKSATTLEKQISFLQGQIDYHQRTLSQVEEENNRLKDKIRRYEFASQNKSMSQIPSAGKMLHYTRTFSV